MHPEFYSETEVSRAFDKAFERIVQKLFPLGTRNKAMGKKDEAWDIFKEALRDAVKGAENV